MRRLVQHPRILAILVWLAAFTAFAVTSGLPTKRMGVFIWVALAVVALGVDHPRSTFRSFATIWLPLFAALGAYDLLRGASDDPDSIAHTWPHMDFDVWLGGGTIPSVRLQELLWDRADPAWFDFASWAVYQSHFFAPLLVAVVLWSIGDRLARRYILALAALSWMALATYWLYPAQPPWMVARDGLVEGDVSRVVQQMWKDVGVERAARVFTTSESDGSRYSNPVAALPSLHAAFPMLIAVVLWGRRRWLDALLSLYVLAMAWTLVYAGEHFVLDIALGWIYALTAGLVAVRYRRPSTRSNGVRSDGVPAHSSSVGPDGIGSAGGAADRSRYTERPHAEETFS